MSIKTKKTSRVLEATHETARDLHAAGLISKRRMKDYDALCLDPLQQSLDARFPDMAGFRERLGAKEHPGNTIVEMREDERS